MFKQKGITYFETIIGISIISALTSLALPSFDSLITSQRSALLADNFFHHLNFARNAAITKNVPITVCSSNSKGNCKRNKDWSNSDIIIFTDHNGNGVLDNKDATIKNLNLGLAKNSFIWRSFGNKYYLQWQPTGMTNYQNGNFTYCPANKNAKHGKKIILNAAGRIYFGGDNNKDGIQEGANGKNLIC
jgi:type IV fimbrial biogenesis protein FimT